MDYSITPIKNLKRLSPEEEKEAIKQAHEYFQKKYQILPKLKPNEEGEEVVPVLTLSELAKQIHRQSDLLSFPLPDIYDADDPHLARDAFSAIRLFRLRLSDVRYISEMERHKKEQLYAAADVALGIRAEFPELREVPVAKNPDCPTEQDFINLEQWFLDALTFEQAEIARWSAKEKTLNAAGEKPLEGDWSKAMQKKEIMQKLGFGLRGYRKLNTFTKEHPIRNVAGNRQLFQIRIDKMPPNLRKKFD